MIYKLSAYQYQIAELVIIGTYMCSMVHMLFLLTSILTCNNVQVTVLNIMLLLFSIEGMSET